MKTTNWFNRWTVRVVQRFMTSSDSVVFNYIVRSNITERVKVALRNNATGKGMVIEMSDAEAEDLARSLTKLLDERDAKCKAVTP